MSKNASLKPWISILIVLFSGALLGLGLKEQNLSFYSSEMIKMVPHAQWAEQAIGWALLLTALYFFETNFLAFLLKQKTDKLFFLNSLSYVFFAGVLLHAPIYILFILFKISKLLLLYVYRKKLLERLKEGSVHIAALLLILISQATFNDFVSPRAWLNPIASLNKDESNYIGPASSAILYDYSNAKKFDFSSFDHSFWGGLPYSPTSGNSSVMPVLVNLFNLPVIDYEWQARILLILIFTLCVLGSFFFYLFLHWGLKLSSWASLLGGLLFVVSNPYLAEQFTYHFPMFFIPFLLLPLALLLSVLAVEKKKKSVGFLSGLIFSTHFYLFFSHPDTIIHATLFWGAFLSFKLWSEKEVSWSDKGQILFCSFLGYGLGAFYRASPIFQFLWTKEAQVFGHTSLVYIFFGLKEGMKIVLMPLFWLGLLAPLAFFPGVWKQIKEKSSKDVLFFISSSLLLLILFFPGYDGPFIKLLEALQIKTLSFKQIARVLMYLHFSVLVVLLYLLERLYQNLDIQRLKLAQGISIAWILLFAFYLLKKWNYFEPFLVGASIVCLFYFLWCQKFGTKLKPFISVGIFSCVLLILLQSSSLPWLGARKNDNPNDCKPYISMQTLLTMQKFHPEDAACNDRLLKNRLKQYEKDANQPVTVGAFDFEVQDQFYLTKHSCIYPKQRTAEYENLNQNTILYNLTGIFSAIEASDARVQSASSHNSTIGLRPGVFLQDANQSIDVRVLKVYPPLNALYMLPGEYYLEVGSYNYIKRWQRQGLEVFSDPKIRKIYNIAGLQYFVVRKDEYFALQDKADLKVMPDPTPESIRSPFLLVKDERANETAYLASSIQYQKSTINHFENYKFPLNTNDSASVSVYQASVDQLTEKLLALKEKNAVIVEDDSKEPVTEVASRENKMRVLNIFGNKAAFQVECKQSPCVVAFNTAALSGWNAYANGKSIPARRSNFAFLSLEAPLGESIVWFEYQPTLMILGYYLTVFGFLCGGILLLKEKALQRFM